MRILGLILVTLFSCLCIYGQDLPVVVSTAAPENYPPMAFVIIRSSEVRIDAQISHQGKVISAKAVSGHPLLQKISEKAALKWRFSSENKPSNSRYVSIVFHFNTWDEEPKVVDGGEGDILTKIKSKFIEPYKMEIIIFKTVLFPKIALLTRINGKIEEKYCELHHVKMKTEILDIIYGLFMMAPGLEDLYEVKGSLFPNANSSLHGGCLIELTQQQEVYYCEKCRKAESEWIKLHRIKQLGKDN